MNVSATLHAFRILTNPSLCLPHLTVSNFGQLTTPLNAALAASIGREKPPDIRAVVLDKDNCFAVPKSNEVFPAYSATFSSLRRAFPKTLLIVSNSSGSSSDSTGSSAAALTAATGVPVLQHKIKKPGCGKEIMEYFRPLGVTRPAQVAVVGDRLLTDVLMANENGMWAVWVRDGVTASKGVEGMFARVEQSLAAFLLRRGYRAPMPAEDV